ncbi:hypothetical protein K1719_045101 [Acacia pycnantha]|nr:hypothetical protein K1719_045101 [Acacia pycnantha]
MRKRMTRRVAVWVRIPDLPLEFCTVESLEIIGNMIGRMIKIDRSTSIYDKGKEGVGTHAGNDDGRNAGNDDGRNLVKKKQTVDGALPPVVDQVPSNHLGPQMVFCRDLRRTTGGMAGNKEKVKMGVAAKSGGGMHGIHDICHGVMKSEGNKVGSKGSAKLVQASVKSEGVILGNSNKTVNDTLKKKPEWIIVGSKRKKEEGPRIFGKENNIRPKPKGISLGKIEAHSLVDSNPFNSLQEANSNVALQDHTPNNVMNGAPRHASRIRSSRKVF